MIYVECIIVKFSMCLYSYTNNSLTTRLRDSSLRFPLPAWLSPAFAVSPRFLIVLVPLWQILCLLPQRTNPHPAASQNWHFRRPHVAAHWGTTRRCFAKFSSYNVGSVIDQVTRSGGKVEF